MLCNSNMIWSDSIHFELPSFSVHGLTFAYSSISFMHIHIHIHICIFIHIIHGLTFAYSSISFIHIHIHVHIHACIFIHIIHGLTLAYSSISFHAISAEHYMFSYTMLQKHVIRPVMDIPFSHWMSILSKKTLV